MRALIFTEAARHSISELRQYASQNPFSMHRIKRIVGQMDPPPGDDHSYVVTIPVGFRVVLTIEEHRPGVWYDHLSVSIETPGKWPHPSAIDLILEEFGMEPMAESLVYPEDAVRAVSVLQRRDG